ncbi:DUF1501 domain-containing protein [Robbsia andropogonis]|uniref:DUF1501 domain-containing protein n=1 Tax=Robbsia andropogonis TaxID=28092 RepID=UPI003D21CE11
MTMKRRDFLRRAGALAAWTAFPGTMFGGARIAFAAVDTPQRFVFVIQRGAADGLNTVVPYADPAYARLRGELALDPGTLHKLDGTFGLHPSLVQTAVMYGQGEALMIHAVASPYRDRSHFDGQNVLETGGLRPYQIRDGWLNRLVALLPPTGGHQASVHRDDAIAFAPTVPLALRGRADVTSYAPSSLGQAQDDLLLRVSRLYAEDAQLHPLWDSAMQTRHLAGSIGTKQDPAAIGKMAAGFLVRPDGPRIAMIETNGWDTHTAQNPRLANTLKSLDTMLAALKEGMGAQWAYTTVVVATEFGRTAAVNGTNDTDHGTGSAAMILGGAVKGGRILADWPGLSPQALNEGRDLRATLALDSLIASAAAETFRLDPRRVNTALFPQSPSPAMRDGILRS